MITGQVSGFQERWERTIGNDSVKVWSFRVERQGGGGEPLPRVAVEMRGKGFDGSIAPGDWVRIDRNWRSGTTLQANSVQNLSTNTIVHARGAGPASRAASRVFVTVVGIFALAILVWVIYGMFQQGAIP
ncbi:hypothetical protein [Micromonospora chersina]|uniref:hypothetical protein n=1 Tax=Micromonospora chersina TaxID=47854 RepID=UPI0037100FB9